MAGVGWPKGKKRGPRKQRPISDIGHGVASGDDDRGDNPSPGAEPVVTVTGDGAVIVDPTAIAGSDGTGGGGSAETGPRRRGRKAKAKNKTTVNVSSVEMMLFSIHNMASTFLNVEELAIEEKEANNLATAIAKVAEHYDNIPGMSETTAAWTNLAMVAGVTYGSRIVAYRGRVAMEKAQKSGGLSQGLM